ncbi:hypothetical protein BD311DRAFT_741182 [Dichomitus squalens]|uniref:Uncharacterized protein n=1 Tax=Dichomitus squalens TaxID=114155 RepID=A0A4Q9MDM1_9APHY|nr:hypothetical protein BD311DRAFT_741182 [Dichomitus squalens]
MSYSRILLVNGVTYVCVLSTLNLIDIVFLALAVNGALADLVTTFSVILLCRFLLDLCETHQTATGYGSASEVSSSLYLQASMCIGETATRTASALGIDSSV